MFVNTAVLVIAVEISQQALPNWLYDANFFQQLNPLKCNGGYYNSFVNKFQMGLRH